MFKGAVQDYMKLFAYSFFQEQFIFGEVVGAEQTPKNTDGCLKQVHVYILVKGQLFFHPASGFCKLWAKLNREEKNEEKCIKGI